ncbi:hypothetical protein ACIRD2_10230 [Streptomyces sp. NPDC093595]|uniref:hypothetical protein n=1 Tax=Streptomyces sp. NPDC093595 TaxID=3366045 RepID=UPI003806BA06
MADPVRVLLQRHRTLCERAVDPLEIAAGLEAHGITDRTAARFRHRDVFSLAEELYARVPHDGEGPDGARGDDTRRDDPEPGPGARDRVPPGGPAAPSGPPGRPYGAPAAADAVRAVSPVPPAGEGRGQVLLPLLPGLVCLTALAGAAATDGTPRALVAAAGAVALAAALAAALRRGPLRARGRTAPALRAGAGLLIAYALFGDGLLAALIGGGPAEPWPPAVATPVALAFAVAPAAWCARFFAVRARRRLTASRGLHDFAAAARPLLGLTAALYTAALTALLLLAGPALEAVAPGGPGDAWGAGGVPSGVALGVLLFAARLLTVHGFPGPAATGLLGACAVEACALAAVLAGRVPGCAFLARPVEAAVTAWGTGAVPALGCGAAALALLARAAVVLARASAHAAP